MTNKPAPRVSWVLLLVLAVALAIGAAASILATASTAPPPPSGTASLVVLPEWAIAAVSWGIVALVVGSLVVWRLTSGPSSALTRMAVTILAIILIGIVFLIVVRFAGFGGFVGMGGSGLPHSSNSTYSSNNTTPLKGNLSGTGSGIILFPSVPGWVPFLILGLVVVLVVAVGVPQTRRYLEDRRDSGAVRRRSAVRVSAGMRRALTQASSELDIGGDPRVVILALYAAMLSHLQPMVDDIGTSTPEEIRAAHLVRLGVRPEAARTLTRLFEEARYSTHPMGRAESTRAQEAVRATLDDLARRTPRE
ncbi:MAG: DUF4129 domain-containing protein [Thermoplasmata archaeon]